MSIIKYFFLCPAVFFLTTALGPFPVSIAGEVRNDAALVITWKLSHGKMVARGTSKNLPEGKLVSGCIIEGEAISADPAAPFARGNYTVSYTAFSPGKNMPGQKAGYWYVTGDWTISSAVASGKKPGARHNPFVTGGSLTAEVPFNPLTDQGGFNAQVLLRSSGKTGKWGSVGRGKFIGNQFFEGELRVPAPKSTKGE